jgi:hypothetical protein
MAPRPVRFRSGYFCLAAFSFRPAETSGEFFRWGKDAPASSQTLRPIPTIDKSSECSSRRLYRSYARHKAP